LLVVSNNLSSVRLVSSIVRGHEAGGGAYAKRECSVTTAPA